MDNFLQRGDVIDFTFAAAVTSGVPVNAASLVVVPQNDAEAGEVVPCLVEGVVLLNLKAGGGDPVAGEPAHFNVATDDVSVGADVTGTGSVNGFGVVAEYGAAGADTTLAVKLTPGVGVPVA